MSALSSRSNSSSSLMSASSMLSPASSRCSSLDLERKATKIIHVLANDPQNLSSVEKHISPHIKTEHGDEEPEYSMNCYLSRFSCTLAGDCHLVVKEACVDELQRKVWVRSEISHPMGRIVDRVDMMLFDEMGVLVGSIDDSKVRRRRC